MEPDIEDPEAADEAAAREQIAKVVSVLISVES